VVWVQTKVDGEVVERPWDVTEDQSFEVIS
jgi:hypothetical protein